jgi:transcription elongation GreA/GreB family factor
MTIDLAAPPQPVPAQRATRAGRTGYVLAAVHPDSHRLDAVIARAAARAAATDTVVVYLTVANSRPIGHHLTRMRARLASAPHPVHLVASWIDGSSVPRRRRPALIAAEIAAAARRLGSSAVVVGHDPATEAPPTGVIGRLVASLPGDVEISLGVEAALTGDFDIEAASVQPSRWQLNGVHLTDAGRRQLTNRARRIERKELPAARRRIRAHLSDAAALLTYERLLNDYRALATLIATAPRTAEIPDDPERVELGERVVLASEDGSRRSLVVVADIEATRGRACAAASSGIGRALLGHRVGDWTSVPTPRGPRRAQILAATRT